jgi:uncharacterized membrane protein
VVLILQTNFPLRVSIHFFAFGETGKEATLRQHVVETLIPFSVSLAVALVVTDVGILFSFVGALTRASMFCIFPATSVLRSRKLAPHLTTWERIGCWLLLVLGAAVTVLGVFASVLKMLDRKYHRNYHDERSLVPQPHNNSAALGSMADFSVVSGELRRGDAAQPLPEAVFLTHPKFEVSRRGVVDVCRACRGWLPWLR